VRSPTTSKPRAEGRRVRGWEKGGEIREGWQRGGEEEGGGGEEGGEGGGGEMLFRLYPPKSVIIVDDIFFFFFFFSFSSRVGVERQPHHPPDEKSDCGVLLPALWIVERYGNIRNVIQREEC